MEGMDTTTNNLEGFNLQVKLSIPRNANIWAIITQFRKEDSLVEAKLREATIGVFPDKGKRTIIEKKERKKK